MNSKTLVIILAVIVGGIAILGQRVTAYSKSGDSGAISLSTSPNPLRIGTAEFMINVKDISGQPVDGATVSFDLNMTTMNMGTQKGNATARGNGRYAAVGRMSMRGPWRVRTSVKMPDGKIENKDFTVNVP